MDINKWLTIYKDKYIATALCQLQKETSHTDDEIIHAIEKISIVGAECGLSLRDCIELIVVNEVMELS